MIPLDYLLAAHPTGRKTIALTDERCRVCGGLLCTHIRCRACTVLIGHGHEEMVSHGGYCGQCTKTKTRAGT